jgi:hypothetical protein
VRTDLAASPERLRRIRPRLTLTRCVLLLGDALLTAEMPVDPDAAVRGTATYRRVQRACRLAGRLFHTPTCHMRRMLVRREALPFTGHEIVLLGYGSGNTVFRVTWESAAAAAVDAARTVVLKVYRKSLGASRDELLHFAALLTRNHDRVRGWYAGTDLVLPLQVLVLQAPLAGTPCVAAVQTYVDGPHEDLFAGFAPAELLRLLCAEPALRAQFRDFVAATLRAVEQEGACLDLHGHGNVVIVSEGGRPRLRVVDEGVYDFATKRERNPAALASVQRRLDYLVELRRRLDDVSAEPANGGRTCPP